MQLAVEVEVKEKNISCQVFLLKETGCFKLRTAWQKIKAFLPMRLKVAKCLNIWFVFSFYEIIVILVLYETGINEKTHSFPTSWLRSSFHSSPPNTELLISILNCILVFFNSDGVTSFKERKKMENTTIGICNLQKWYWPKQ